MLSIIVPVFNEEDNILELYSRIKLTLEKSKITNEIIFVDDGSKDKSLDIINDLSKKNKEVKYISFYRNFGQHAAVIAGFKEAIGKYVLTLDADLQNPPEEIPKLIKEIEKGYDVVGGYRKNRKDSFIRKTLSFIMNKVISRLTGVKLKDYGCMMRVYKISLIKQIIIYGEKSVYIPSFAAWLTNNIKEIDVKHDYRKKGKTKYSLIKLLSQAFDLITTYTLIPLQIIFLIGVFVFFIGIALFIYLMMYRFFYGTPSSLTSFIAILILLSGLIVLSIGIISEYLIRIYRETRKFPFYIIKKGK